eukprot:TRINITY_DN60_c0_g2_i1.p1 TRINITY_DN60_c0_g2~~TRINITY_DN60_c0_g2_i1.p1  ORF type:complete len:220 (+),score=66.49 TRINITY_DN60_c0_g2_i1:55-660(+)
MARGRPCLKLDSCVVVEPPTEAVEEKPEESSWGASSVVGDWLFIGGYLDACNERWMRANEITHVVNAASECTGKSICHPSCVLNLELKDNLSAPIADYFNTVCEFIDRARSEGGKVLIHCKKGISRSPALTLAYLITRFNIPLEPAYNMILKKRPSISPNLGFILALRELEASYLSSTHSQRSSSKDSETSMQQQALEVQE